MLIKKWKLEHEILFVAHQDTDFYGNYRESRQGCMKISTFILCLGELKFT